MKKNYIKMNDNDFNLSLGNLFRIIKELSKNKRGALQTEIFCTLFNICDINDTTVNNYCVGCRTIGDEYKQIFLSKENKYHKNNKEFVDTIINLLSIIDSKIINNASIEYINNSDTINILVNKLFNLAKNDKQVKDDYINNLSAYIQNKNYYDALVLELLFIVLEKKQPLYESDLKLDVLENVLLDTSISSNELKEYLSLKLRESINFEYSMKRLASNGNAYAAYELGLEEYYGHVVNYSRYDRAYEYFLIGAPKNHPGCNYMLGVLLVRGWVGDKSNDNLKLGYDYLIKSKELGHIAALNNLGLMYKEGIYPCKKDLDEAKRLFTLASNNNYAFAINNLGRMEEEDGNTSLAYELYKKSADLGESWACNKYACYLRENGNVIEAFNYYNRGLDINYHTICTYIYYNLAKYYYLNGCKTFILKPDKNKAIEYFNKSSDLIESLKELFYLYLEDYMIDRNQDKYELVLNIKNKIECHVKYNDDIKKEIENKIKEIKKEINIEEVI